MHDLRVVREQIDWLREGMRRRGRLEALGPIIDRIESLDQERRAMIQAVEERKAVRNVTSQDVARLKRAGQDAEEMIVRGRELGVEIARLEKELADVQLEIDDLLLEIPNVPLPEVPEGGEESNVIVREWGTPRPGDGVAPHWEVAERLGLLDLGRAAKISGSGFAVFRGRGARLVRALLNYFLDLHVGEHGYEETWVPVLVTRRTMYGTGQLPKFEEDMYGIRDEDLFLIPTAEVPVTNLHRDEILDGAVLPVALTAYSPCFRREAGAAGKDTRGILRMHQFDKVELVRYTTPEQGAEEHERLTRHAETALERLGLPYRRVLLAAGDTGFASAKTFDLEVWAPGVGTWLEVSSCSIFTDFQARRANIRYRPAPGERPRYIHTLNGSGLAFPRVIAAILEHYQRPDGSVEVPEALRPYLGSDVIG